MPFLLGNLAMSQAIARSSFAICTGTTARSLKQEGLRFFAGLVFKRPCLIQAVFAVRDIQAIWSPMTYRNLFARHAQSRPTPGTPSPAQTPARQRVAFPFRKQVA
jgi:hypothetical protein